MSVAEHAENILSAWASKDYSRFDAEVESALMSCETTGNHSRLELERHELLRSVARHLGEFRLRVQPSESRLHAGFSLLRHLAGSKDPHSRITIVRQ